MSLSGLFPRLWRIMGLPCRGPKEDTMSATDPEYTVVPPEERLDHDEDGSDDTDAIDEETGTDQVAIDMARATEDDQPLWEGE